MNTISNITRSPGDPRVLQSGPSSLGVADRAAHALGFISYGLGAAELLAPRLLTRALDMRGMEALVRCYGAREIASGVLTLSTETELGLWSRVAGDGLDIMTVLAALQRTDARKRRLLLALVVLVGITAADVASARAVAVRHARRRGAWQQRTFDRSGFPRGLDHARELGRRAAGAAGAETLREVAG